VTQKLAHGLPPPGIVIAGLTRNPCWITSAAGISGMNPGSSPG
jgi:hypothetical protein